MSDTDDLPARSTQDSAASDDPAVWETVVVKLYACALEWLAPYLRDERATPSDSQASSFPTRLGAPELPESAVLHFNPDDRLGQMFGGGACRGRLELPLRTVPVFVLVCAGLWGKSNLELSLREAQAPSTPMHPRVMATLGSGAFIDGVAVVLPDLGGSYLRTYLRTHPNADKRRLIIQIAEGLDYLHYQAAVVYGNLAPTSVHINALGDVVLEDPMLNNWIRQSVGALGLSNFSPAYTQQTLRYVAPEIVPLLAGTTSESTTRESDMYAFGMLVYEILSGREPWADAKLVDIFRFIVSGQLLAQPEDGTTDDSMWQLCTACWNQNPADRPGIANVLAGLFSNSPPARWRPDIVVGRDQWPRPERLSLEEHPRYAIPKELQVEIGGSVVNIFLPKQEAIAGAFGTVMKGYTYGTGIVTAYAVKICIGKNVMPREYEIWKSLSHRNILPLLGVVDTSLSNTPARFFISPYLSGGTLVNCLESSPFGSHCFGRLYLMLNVAVGLAYLHDVKAIVHGDIKPENILIGRLGIPVLADFGFSTYVAPSRKQTILEVRQVFTLAYCAPEILDDTAEDPSAPGVIRSKTKMSDMFAYGVLLYYTFAGGLGQSQRDRIRLMLDMYDGRFPPRPVGREPVLDDIWSICTRCWAKNPSQRPPIATVLAELVDLSSDDKISRTSASE